MIDYDKINEYAATILSKSISCQRVTEVAWDELLGFKNQYISEKTLHEGFECAIARSKQKVEEDSYATTEQKEMEKNRWEYSLKSLEEQVKADLKRKNRLL